MSESEPHYELEDLWRHASPIGLTDRFDYLSEYNWKFSNLGDAFKEGGVLHAEKVSLFSQTESQVLYYNGEGRVTAIPVVVAIVSPFPPSDKIGISSVQRVHEEIVDMMEMNMDWVPYIPLGEREQERGVERLNPQIFILRQIEAASEPRHLDNTEYCLPYFYNPFNEIKQSTIVDIDYPTEPRPVICEFDWELDELKVFTNELIDTGELSGDHRDAFKEFVKEKVQEGKRANHEEIEKQIQAQEELRSQGRVVAYEQMRFYKFYPVATRDTPNISRFKCSFINRYYGQAHQVL